MVHLLYMPSLDPATPPVYTPPVAIFPAAESQQRRVLDLRWIKSSGKETATW